VRKLFLSIFVLAAGGLAALAVPGAAPQEAPGAGVSPQAAQGKPTLAVAVVDPAHGGTDSGARGAAGIVESEIVLDFARAIRVALEGQGLRVLLTREGNEGPSFDSRSAMVNGQRAAVFISLHVSSTGPAGTARTYWYSFPSDAPAPDSPLHRGLVQWNQAQRAYLASSQRLAETVQTQIAQRFMGSNAMPAAAPVRQLRTIAAPGIAIEVSSVAVPDTQQLIKMASPLAEAVARGVADYRSSEANR
jgi:N-acetylmuramoyl-L-alanine amidase